MYIRFINRIRPFLSSKAGFTITELAIVIGILAVISTVTLVSFNQYVNRLWLRAVSQEIALMFRDAQGKAINVAGNNNFLGKFGVYLEENSNTATLFLDVDGDDRYDRPPAGCEGECLKNIYFAKDIIVKDICTVVITAGGESGDCNPFNMSAVYVRPEPDARLGYDGIPAAAIDKMIIKLGMENDTMRANITVGATGYVSISYDE